MPTTCKDEKTEVRAYGFMCRETTSVVGLALPDSIGCVRRSARLRIWNINLPINMHSCMDHKEGDLILNRMMTLNKHADLHICEFEASYSFSPQNEGVSWL